MYHIILLIRVRFFTFFFMFYSQNIYEISVHSSVVHSLCAETLVHSTLEHCDDADFTFNIFFNMKDYIVYVKQRPFLHKFLERVSDMFEVVIFTASQSIYANQLLDILDPDEKFISRRLYRESCMFSDGNYTKDLTILGIDLAKVVIIDNSPQVYNISLSFVGSSFQQYISFSSLILSSSLFLFSIDV